MPTLRGPIPVLLTFPFLLVGCSAELSPTALVPSPHTVSEWWRPVPGLTWQWQIGDNEIDLSAEAEIFDIDSYVDQAFIDEIHRRGSRAICYVSVGSWEEWRSDADAFPQQVLGTDYEGWPGERWIDIRRIDVLGPVLRARLDMCQAKRFDGVEPDNIDIYHEDTGFALSYADQIAFARWLVDEAHARGLAIGLKNAPDMVTDTVGFFDFAVTEDAFYEGWIAQMLPFVDADKAVLAAEYTDTEVDFPAACEWGQGKGVSFILKDRELGSWVRGCP